MYSVSKHFLGCYSSILLPLLYSHAHFFLLPISFHYTLLFIVNSHFFYSDPNVKIIGQPEAVSKARETLLNDLDTKSNRVTLKINVAYGEHSHVIGKEGANIKKGLNRLKRKKKTRQTKMLKHILTYMYMYVK